MKAAKEQTSYFGVKTAPFTHVNLLSGRKGRVIEQGRDQVAMECEFGTVDIYEKSKLHLTWAPLNSDSQGEQA
ncbi:hypothetical protein [Aeromonas sobria]|uniref:hypothetical protein n=1 Tax=Aeromonas sobria TaxID=646 RepID=UPI0026EDF3B1|nr:hypothetical protein [Aeromonas sobria]